jgi:8-oxo-dGTP diphosphatase
LDRYTPEMPHELPARPEFGEREPGVAYVRRPGAYAVAFDSAGRVAVVRTPKGCALPGGGAEPGESPEATLRREVREECGSEVHIGEACGEAIDYVHARGEGHFAKVCRFYRAALGPPTSTPAEPDHELVWLDVPAALTRLTHGSHAWIVERLAAGTGSP